METVIEYKGVLHFFKRPIHYTERMFLDRCWYIVKNVEEKDIEALADIWISVKYLEAQYPKDIMEKIRNYEVNMVKPL